MAQFGSALVSGTRGREFESRRPDHIKSLENRLESGFFVFYNNSTIVVKAMTGNEEAKEKGTWGGAREGGGRPKLAGDAVTKQVQFRLTAEQTVIVKHFVKMLKAGEIDAEAYKKESLYSRRYLAKCLLV